MRGDAHLPALVQAGVPVLPRLVNDRWGWLFKVVTLLYTALEKIMASEAELQIALDKNTADTKAAGAAITTELAQLAAAIAALKPGAAVSQAQIDQLTASSTALEAATASLVADDPAAPPTPPAP